jgi:hypothetical protein
MKQSIATNRNRNVMEGHHLYNHSSAADKSTGYGVELLQTNYKKNLEEKTQAILNLHHLMNPRWR